MAFRSERLDKLPPYLFAELERKRTELEKAGRDVINLGIGDPDSMPPAPLRTKLAELLATPDIHQYSPSQGIDPFRESIARWLKRNAGLTLDPKKQILMGIGSKELIGHLPLATTNPGDVVIFPEPGYPPYRSGTVFAMCEPWVMPLREKNGFLPDLSEIPRDVAKRAKIIYVNYPNNPTGAVATRAFYEDLVRFAREFNVLVVSDAAYMEIYFGERPLSFLSVPGGLDVGIEVYSMTKTFSMAGWRLAWAAGRADVLETLRSLKANLDSGQFMALQAAAAYGLEQGEAYVKEIREMYRRRLDIFVDGLSAAGWKIRKPPATFYVWFPVPRGTSMEFADRALKEANVVMTPGIGFGANAEGYLRATMTVPEDRLREAVKRLSKLT